MDHLCGKCGANMALVGRMHACRQRPDVTALALANARKTAVNTPLPAVNTAVNKSTSAVNTAQVKASASSTSNATSYARQRVDPEKRRAYMRAYMAKRRRSTTPPGAERIDPIRS